MKSREFQTLEDIAFIENKCDKKHMISDKYTKISCVVPIMSLMLSFNWLPLFYSLDSVLGLKVDS